VNVNVLRRNEKRKLAGGFWLDFCRLLLELNVQMQLPNESILIIDDSLLYRTLLSQCFKIAGWRVFQADTGNTGLAKAREVLPSYIICDMVMPDGGGMDVVKGVRADARLQNTKIVMFTGSDNAEERDAALGAGANAYLVKPVKVEEIFSLVEKFKSQQSRPTEV
jgi:DNA-binding response OmpR family regulator